MHLKADGMPDPTFTPPALHPETVYTLLPQSGGQVLIGGWIVVNEGGLKCRGLLRLNPNGTWDTNYALDTYPQEPKTAVS